MFSAGPQEVENEEMPYRCQGLCIDTVQFTVGPASQSLEHGSEPVNVPNIQQCCMEKPLTLRHSQRVDT